MSVETLTIIIAAAGLLVTLGGGIFAGFAWTIRRTDAQFTEVREEFRAVHQEFRSVRQEFREDLHQLHGELTEVKISLARLEGPRERLILPCCFVSSQMIVAAT